MIRTSIQTTRSHTWTSLDGRRQQIRQFLDNVWRALAPKFIVCLGLGTGVFLNRAAAAVTPVVPSRNSAANAPGIGNTGYFMPKGDCRTDDSAAIQSMLDTGKFVYLPKPDGGCYLIAHTLIMRAGNLLFGAGANNPNPFDPTGGVILKLAPNANVPLLRTYTALDPPGGGNEYMAIQNVVFDGSGSQQSQELTEALVDWRGTFIETFLSHVVITNAYGPALFTGSSRLDNVWIINTTTSTYAWVHNPGPVGRGGLMADQVFVEETMRPEGGRFLDAFGNKTPVNLPNYYGHAIHFNGMGSATLNQLHCESAATCLDLNDIYSLSIQGISGNRIGDPSSNEPSDQYLIRALNTEIHNINFTAAYFDQSGTSYQGQFLNQRVFGLHSGLESNELYETPIGRTSIPSWSHGTPTQGWSATPYLGSYPTVGNSLYIQKIGQSSPNRVAFLGGRDTPDTDYSFLARDGNSMSLGFSSGPLNVSEEHMILLNYFGTGDPRNYVQIPNWIQTGSVDNSDLTGELMFESARSVVYPFKHTFQVHPECQITPQFDLGQNGRLWTEYRGNSLEVHSALTISGSVSYHCWGRN
jgi:hypothetical protein